VPFRASSGAREVEEAQVRLLLTEGVGVDPEGQLGVRVAERSTQIRVPVGNGELIVGVSVLELISLWT